MVKFFLIFIVIQLQLYAFSPHPSRWLNFLMKTELHIFPQNCQIDTTLNIIIFLLAVNKLNEQTLIQMCNTEHTRVVWRTAL